LLRGCGGGGGGGGNEYFIISGWPLRIDRKMPLPKAWWLPGRA